MPLKDLEPCGAGSPVVAAASRPGPLRAESTQLVRVGSWRLQWCNVGYFRDRASACHAEALFLEPLIPPKAVVVTFDQELRRPVENFQTPCRRAGETGHGADNSLAQRDHAASAPCSVWRFA